MARKAAQQGPDTIAEANEKTPENTEQILICSILSGVLQAEDTGLEPAAPYGVPQFQ